MLVFSLLLLFVMLSMTLSIATIFSYNIDSTLATVRSNMAYQVADGAAEDVLKRVYNESDSDLTQLANRIWTSGAGNANCNNDVIAGSLPTATEGSFTVAFLDNSGVRIACNDVAWRSKLVYLLAKGTHRGTVRSIYVGVRPGPCAGLATVNDTDGNTYDTIAIGNQCWMKQNMRVGTRINSSTAQSNNSTVEKYCYNDSDANCTDLHPNQPDGGLYMWDEAMQYVTTEGAQGICPANFHVPTDAEWHTLELYLTDAGQTCDANRTGWDCASASVNLRPGGSSGFEANFTGYVSGGASFGRGAFDYYISSTGGGNSFDARLVDPMFPTVWRVVGIQKSRGNPLRCIKD